MVKSLSAVMEGGFRQKDITRITGLSVVSYDRLETGSVAELREEAHAGPHTLTQYALICCEELDTMRPSELNQLKEAVTMKTVDERAAYAH